LDSFNIQLSIPVGIHTLYTYVMEATSESGPFTPIFSDSGSYVGGLGPVFYGSGRMHVRLNPGRLYFFAFGWNPQGLDPHRTPGTYPQPWALGSARGLAGLNGVTNPVVGPQSLIGPFTGANYAMRMTFAIASGCYPNCDGSTTPPVLTVADFGCFLNAFAA